MRSAIDKAGLANAREPMVQYQRVEPLDDRVPNSLLHRPRDRLTVPRLLDGAHHVLIRAGLRQVEEPRSSVFEELALLHGR